MQKNLPFNLSEFFITHLKQAITRDFLPPIPLEFNRVYRVAINEFYPPIKFIIYLTPEPHLDYYIPYGEYGPNSHASYHGRIQLTGERIKLENYEGQWGYSTYPDDPDRTAQERKEIEIHNQQVDTLLRAKGFII